MSPKPVLLLPNPSNSPFTPHHNLNNRPSMVRHNLNNHQSMAHHSRLIDSRVIRSPNIHSPFIHHPSIPNLHIRSSLRRTEFQMPPMVSKAIRNNL